MKAVKSSLIVLASAGLLFLGACNQEEKAANQNSNPATPAASQPEPSKPAAAPAGTTKTDSPQASKGGQVVEAGAYHLEFVPEKESTGTHLDLFISKGDKHEPVPNAKVSGQVQLPNGKQQTLAFKYDPEEKHYASLFPIKTPGQYPVKVMADIGGEKVNGRFNFNQ